MQLSAEACILEDGAEVHIHLDRKGLDYLIRQLEHLRNTDHVHLFAPAWGGNDLTEEVFLPDGVTVPHIKIHLQPDGE